jgi:hypothetical protein
MDKKCSNCKNFRWESTGDGRNEPMEMWAWCTVGIAEYISETEEITLASTCIKYEYYDWGKHYQGEVEDMHLGYVAVPSEAQL